MNMNQGKNFLQYRKQKSKDVQNRSKLAVDGVDSSEKEIKNIGDDFSDFFQKIYEFTGFRGFAGLEGFDKLLSEKDSLVAQENKKELDELQDLESQLNNLLSKYGNLHKSLMSDTKDYLESVEGANKYSGKNLRLKNNQTFFVTDDGYYKKYASDKVYEATAGKNGCPANFTTVDADSIDKLDRKLIRSTPMKSGQSCANTGRNVFVTEPAQPIANTADLKNVEFVGCLNRTTDENPNSMTNHVLSAQNEQEAFQQAASIAQESGRPYFSLWKNENGVFQMASSESSWGGADTTSILGVLKTVFNKFTESHKTLVSFSTKTTGAVKAIFTPWGTIELLDKDNKVIWSTVGAGGGSAAPECIVDYDKLDQNPAMLDMSNSQATYGANCNGKNKMNDKNEPDGRYDVKLGNFTENVKLWSDHTDLTKDNKFTVDWKPIADPGDCCGDPTFKSWFDSGSSKCTSAWYKENCSKLGTAHDEKLLCDRYLAERDAYIAEEKTLGFLFKSAKEQAKRDAAAAQKKYDDCVAKVNECKKCETCYKKCGNRYIDQITRPTTSDPAVGCDKEFTATYKCGTVAKTLTIPAEAYGKAAAFDCGKEMAACLFVFKLSDDGNLTVAEPFEEDEDRKKDQKQGDEKDTSNVIWESGTKGKVSLVNSDWFAGKGKYGKSFFFSGKKEIVLNPGEFIGSSNGKSRVVLTKDGNLQIEYSVISCDSFKSVNFDESSNKNPIRSIGNVNSMSVYRIKGVNNRNLGKVGYVDDNTFLHQYPNSQIKLEKGKPYIKKSGYLSAFGKNDTLKTMDNVSDPKECEVECDKDEKCAGFNYVTSQDGNTCTLGDISMYPNLSEINGPRQDASIHMRPRTVVNHPSCNTDVIPLMSDQWDKYPEGKNMTMKTLCGLGVIAEKDYKQLEDVNKEIVEVSEKINSKINSLQQTNSGLTKHLGTSKKMMDKKVSEFKQVYDTIQKKQVSKGQTIDGLLSFSDIVNIRSNYSSVLWLLLAISASLILLRMMSRR